MAAPAIQHYPEPHRDLAELASTIHWPDQLTVQLIGEVQARWALGGETISGLGTPAVTAKPGDIAILFSDRGARNFLDPKEAQRLYDLEPLQQAAEKDAVVTLQRRPRQVKVYRVAEDTRVGIQLQGFEAVLTLHPGDFIEYDPEAEQGKKFYYVRGQYAASRYLEGSHLSELLDDRSRARERYQEHWR